MRHMDNFAYILSIMRSSWNTDRSSSYDSQKNN